MKSEEIKAMGLREGDVVRVTVEGKLTGVTVKGPGFSISTVQLSGETSGDMPSVLIPDDAIIAIERVMPELPDGWEWGHPKAARLEVGYVNPKGVRPIRAWVTEDGDIQIMAALLSVSGAVFLPAAVAKALIEVWERKHGSRPAVTAEGYPSKGAQGTSQ